MREISTVNSTFHLAATIFQIYTQNGEKIPIHFGVKITIKLYQHFGSDTIAFQ